MFLRMLTDPVGLLLKAARDEHLDVKFKKAVPFGVSVALAGYGYPFAFVKPPELPIGYSGPLHGRNFDLWWNQVELRKGLVSGGHRLADVVGFGGSVQSAAREAYARIGRIRCLSSYFRTDIGGSLWPPGVGW
jgi:phosphoribosylamine-glycine ligase